jgi:hypothetical protein
LNFKIVALVTLIAGLVLVPLVAAAPVLLQQRTQDRDMLQTQDQDRLQIRDCTSTCVCDETGEGTQLQTQVQEQKQAREQQQLQTRECASTSACNGNGNGDALQTRARLCEGYGDEAANGNLNMEQYNCQYRYRHQNQTP